MPKTAVSTIIALRAGDMPELKDGKLPDKLKLFPWGDRDTGKGRVTLNAAAAANIKAANRIDQGDTVALDFDHNTVPGHPSNKGEPAPIAANCKLEIVEGEGLYFVPLNWTPDGEKFVGEGHYKDLSVAVTTNAKGEITRVHSGAVCRNGEVADVKVFNVAVPSTDSDLATELRGMLSLPEDADAHAILQAIKDAMEKTKPDKSPADPAEKPAADVEALSRRLTEMEGQIKTLSGNADESERKIILDRAAAEGRQVPASARDLPLDKLKALCAELPVTVPLSERTPEHVKALSQGVSDGPAFDPALGARMGVSKELFEQYNR